MFNNNTTVSQTNVETLKHRALVKRLSEIKKILSDPNSAGGLIFIEAYAKEGKEIEKILRENYIL